MGNVAATEAADAEFEEVSGSLRLRQVLGDVGGVTGRLRGWRAGSVLVLSMWVWLDGDVGRGGVGRKWGR